MLSLLSSPTLTSICDYWKNQSFDYFVSKVMSLHFNMLSRFVIAFLPRSKMLNYGLGSCLVVIRSPLPPAFFSAIFWLLGKILILIGG